MKKARIVTITPHGRLAEVAEAITVEAHDAMQAVTALVRNFPKAEMILRQGKFRLNAEGMGDLSGSALMMPITADRLDLIPQISGGAKGRGKAILGLTLIGLSFVPGVNAGIGQGFAAAGGAIGPSAATAFQSFGTSLLGRAGGLLLLSGLAEMNAPQVASPAGQLPSASLPVPNVDGQGAAIPLAYGEARVVQPVLISSAFHVDTIR